MFANVAYLHNSFPDIADNSAPLIVTACGFYRIHSCPVVSTHRLHGREDYQLLYLAKGRGFFLIGGEMQTIDEGTMILFRPHETQIYDYYAADRTEVYWVHFTGSAAAQYLRQYGFLQDENCYLTGSAAALSALYDHMIAELQLTRTNFDVMLSLYLQQLLATAQRLLQEQPCVSNQMRDEIYEATQYFNTHYHEPISIDRYAADCHMSTCWFIRSFQQVVKQTPLQYILSLRMANAQSLLENTAYNISEIAAAVGYENPLYFSRLFRRHMGVPPSEYRKSHRARE